MKKNKVPIDEKDEEKEENNSHKSSEATEPEQKSKLEEKEKDNCLNELKTKASISKSETEIDKPFDIDGFHSKINSNAAEEEQELNSLTGKKEGDDEKNKIASNQDDKLRKEEDREKKSLQTVFYMSNFNDYMSLREKAYREKNIPVQSKKEGRKSKKKKNSQDDIEEPLYQFWYDCPVPFKGNLRFGQIMCNDSENKYSAALNRVKNSELSEKKKEKKIQIGNKFESDTEDSQIKSTYESKSDESTVIVKKCKIETKYSFSPFLPDPNSENYQTNRIWFDCPVPFKGNFHFKNIIKNREENESKSDENAELLDKIRKHDEAETKLHKMNNRCCSIF